MCDRITIHYTHTHVLAVARRRIINAFVHHTCVILSVFFVSNLFIILRFPGMEQKRDGIDLRRTRSCIYTHTMTRTSDQETVSEIPHSLFSCCYIEIRPTDFYDPCGVCPDNI